MDAITIGLLIILTGTLAAGILVLRGRRSRARRPAAPLVPSPGRKASGPQQGELALDQHTRFVETPQRKQYRLLNDAEQTLYHRLCEAMPNMRVFAQVGIAQLAQLRGRREAMQFAPLAGRGVDFVVCNPDFGIVAAIELAWPTTSGEHESEKREALRRLGVPLICFRPNDLPDAEAISLEIANAIVQRNRLEAERR